MTEYEQLLTHVPYLLLVIFRIAGLMVYAPVLSSSTLHPRVKIALAVGIGLVVYPLSSVGPERPVPLELWALAPLVGFEMAIGLAIGLIGLVPLQAVQLGGRMMSQQMGLAFAQIFDPAMESSADVISQILFYMTLAGFLAIGGLESLLLAVMNSFHHLPPGTGVIDGDLVALLLGLLTSAFELAIRVSAPVIGLIFLQGVAMGFITKTVPQLNILSLGFPLRILIGIAVLAFGLVAINDVMMASIQSGFDLLYGWIESG